MRIATRRVPARPTACLAGTIFRSFSPASVPVEGFRSGSFLLSTVNAGSRRRFHFAPYPLYAADDENKTLRGGAEESEPKDQGELDLKQQALNEAALEEMERREAYERWVETVRKELKEIEERVTNPGNNTKSTGTIPQKIDRMVMKDIRAHQILFFLAQGAPSNGFRTSLWSRRLGGL